jgi:hypothetical protein
MKVARFFEHWGIEENPFRAEEARHDAVFRRLGVEGAAHPDFDKIVGELDRPSTSIVFGEKGSGKTAIRLQIAQRVREHNASAGTGGVFLVPYDDLNAALDHFCAALGRRAGDDPLESLKKFRLVDHMDAILQTAVVRLIDCLLEDPRREDSDVGEGALKRLRNADPTLRRDLMALQAVYDRPEESESRATRLRRSLRAPHARTRLFWEALAAFGWIPAVAVYLYDQFVGVGGPINDLGLWASYGLAGVWGLCLVKWFLFDFAWRRWRQRRLARKIAGQCRTLGRSASSLSRTLSMLPAADLSPQGLPVDDADEARYAMFDRLRRVLGVLGFQGVTVVVDRIDEPTIISGDPDRMRAIVWPLLNNKFLQLDGFGFKLLLPIELRHLLFRESSAFFQEARLDKQSLVEQLGWTGSTLYDLCNARLAVCRRADAQPLTLLDLYEDDVTQRDLVDALDQMRQPRDAFKMLYQCIQEHCQLVTDDEHKWRIPRLVLEGVRRQQAERVQQLFRGVRPA